MKQEIADIRSEFDQEDNKIPVKVESILNKIQKSHDDLKTKLTKAEEKIEKNSDEYNTVYKETKKRQTKIQELEREIDTITGEKDKILADTKHEDYDELKKYKSDNEVKVADEKKITRKQFIERYEKIKEHDDYGKTKSKFILSYIGEEKDGKIDWDKISDDDMVLNMQKLEEQEGYGLFGGKKTVIDVNTENVGKTGTKTDNIYAKQFPKI